MVKQFWHVRLSKKVDKGMTKIPTRVRDALALLMADIEADGPVRGDWPNYGKLSPTRHHCHLKKGRPTYVAVWEEFDEGIRLVEIIYAGTHEKAPY